MQTTATTRPARDRTATQARFIEAVEALLVEGGFTAVTPTAVAARAQADKMLIYRYFGGLDGLMLAVVDRPGFFPDASALVQGDLPELLALPVPRRMRVVMERYTAALVASPVALELMAWEMIERNALTAVAETARESLGFALMADIFPDVDRETAALTGALMVSGLTYLLLRRRKIRTFNGLDLRTDAVWGSLLDGVEAATAGLIAAGKA